MVIGRPFASRPLAQFTFTNGLPCEKFPGGAIQHVEKSVAIAPQHQLARRALPIRVDQHGDLHRVVVVRIVRRELEMPFELAGIGIERDHGIGIEIVAGALRGIPVGAGIAGAPVDQVQIRIVGTCDPDRAAAVLPIVSAPAFVSGLAGSGNGIEPPGFLARFAVKSGDESADAEFPAARRRQSLYL